MTGTLVTCNHVVASSILAPGSTLHLPRLGRTASSNGSAGQDRMDSARRWTANASWNVAKRWGRPESMASSSSSWAA